jgi:type IV secretory pathway VirB4 component
MPPNNSFFSQPSAPSGAPAPAPQPAPAPIPTPPTPAPVIGSGDTKQAKATVKNPNSTQNTLQLSEVRDNMVIMLDGSFRAVIRSKAINFDLMSDREREGVEFSYQNFLNSLNFPIQILVRSQRVDIGPYIDRLVESRRSQDNMLLGVLMDDYINFIDELSVGANIMEKSFYIVIPYFPQGDGANLLEQGKGFFGKLFARPKNTITKIDTAAYEKAKEEIKNRVDAVMAGMFQIGVQSTQLNTKALGELYYNFYNPDTAVRQPLGDFENTTSTFVKKAPTGAAPTPGGVL